MPQTPPLPPGAKLNATPPMPTGATTNETPPLPPGAKLNAASPSEKSTWESAKEWLPSARTVTTLAGAGLGGALSLPSYLVGGPAGVAATGVMGGLGAAAGGQLYDYATGTDTDDTPTSDFLGGAFQEGGGRIVGNLVKRGAERGITKSVERAVGPSGRPERQAIQKAAPLMGEDFPVAGSVKSLNTKVGAKVDDLTNELESAWARLPQTAQIPTAQARVALQQERNKLFNSNGTIVKGAEKLDQELVDMIDYLNQNPTFSPADLRNNRQLWDKFVKWYRPDTVNASTAPEKEQAFEIAANGLRETINRSFPAIKALNERVSAYIPASKVLDRRETMNTGQQALAWMGSAIPSTFRSTIFGGAAGHASGLGAMEGAALGAAAQQIINSTAFQTASIPVKRQVVRLLNNGMGKEAVNILTGLAGKGMAGTSVNLESGEITEPQP